LRLEQKVLDFSKAFQINIDSKIAIEDLTAVLTEVWLYDSGIISEQELEICGLYMLKAKLYFHWISITTKAFILKRFIII
jgi:hypothetical protein